MFYKLIINDSSRFLGNGLLYESAIPLQVGQLVEVPVGKNTKQAIVLCETNEQSAYEIKKITSVVSKLPLLKLEHLQLIQWLATEYYCTLTQAAKLFIPGKDWLVFLPQKQEVVQLLEQNAVVAGTKQQLVVEALQAAHGRLGYKDLCSRTGASRSTINTLQERQILTCKNVVLETVEPIPLTNALPPLNERQQQALAVLQSSTKPTYVFGVTGSGKTEVYCHAIEQAIQAGKQAIVLVPEIFLTEHLVERYRRYFPPENIAVLHSKLTGNQRLALWHAIKSGEKNIIIGSRSALFAPCSNLGLLIVDEEHDWSFKQESAPRYHARTVVQKYAALANAKLLLGSATPSLECWQSIQQKMFALAELPERFSTIAPPQVHIVDLAEVPFNNEYPFSPRLIEGIRDRLARKEQVVLFLNRRGTASALLCRDCRRRVISPLSQLPFTVHTDRNGREFLLDHSSDVRAPLPEACPACGGRDLFSVGAGTQRAEQVLQTLFPQARTVRIDKDTLKSRTSLKESLAVMESGEGDILLGTQTVVKGLDLPKVTLAAVLVADIGLSLPHFRAGERVFQLLSQLIGRSGRATAGEVIIQTWRPDADEIKLAAEHDVHTFTTNELKMRTHVGYPPAVPMFRLLARGPKAHALLQSLKRQLIAHAEKTTMKVSIQLAPTYFGAGKEWHILVRGANAHTLLAVIPLEQVHVDTDPYDCL